VKLLPGEDAAQLLSLGMPLSRTGGSKRGKQSQAVGGWRFAQPCAAFDGCRCRIYSSRPKYCKEFDCLLLKAMQQGRVSQHEALRVIHATLRRVEKVRNLLWELGDKDEKTALADRFRRLSRRFERPEPNPRAAEQYGRLTVAFHQLSVTLQESFYPGP
jgi:Fe-S-cluster containining protein